MLQATRLGPVARALRVVLDSTRPSSPAAVAALRVARWVSPLPQPAGGLKRVVLVLGVLLPRRVGPTLGA